MNRRHRIAILAGVFITTGLLFSAQTYIYAPMVGGIAAAAVSSDTPLQGAKAGVLLGIAMFLVGTVLAVGVVVGPLSDVTGIDKLLESLRGIGPKTPLFYATFVYVIGLYNLITGAVFGTLTGAAMTILPVNTSGIQTDHE